MRLPRWAATLPLSLALHVVVIVAGLAFLRMESAPTALILDLDAIIAGGAEEPGAVSPLAGGNAAPRLAPAPKRSATPSPPVAVARPSRSPESVAAPRASDPTPATPPTAAPVPAQSPAPAQAPPASTSPSPAPMTAPSASGVDVDRTESRGSPRPGDETERADGAGQSGGTERAGEARRPASSIAALSPGTGSGTGVGIGSEYAGYLARIRQRIQESLRYPPAARRRGVTGTVQLEISIGADGAIAGVTVIGSSSHEVLDRAALDAARSLPRVPFPADVHPRPLTVRLPVVFELQ